MSNPESYAEAPEDIRAAVEHLIRNYGSDPALLARAIVSATHHIIIEAKAAERERCALEAEAPAEAYEAYGAFETASEFRQVAHAIRKGGWSDVIAAHTFKNQED